MSYVTILWAAAAAAALLLGLVYGLVWAYDRRARANLAFAVAGIGLACGAITELGMLHATSPAEWARWLWWLHLPLFVIVSAMALFLRLYLRAGRLWLLTMLIALRGVVLVLNLVSDPNVNFQRVDSIARMPFLGEHVTALASGVTGEYQWIASIASILFPLFILDVVVTLWRRRTPEARRVALLIGGPVLVAVLISVVLTQLVIWGIVQLPSLLIPPFLISLFAMALEVSRDVLRASRLARDLRESEQRLELAAHAAGAGLWAWDAASGRIWATERARTMLGLPRTGDIVASDLGRMLDRHDAPAVGAVLDQALRRGGEHAAEFRVALAGKGTRWIAVQGSVEIDAHGRPELLRGFVQDVTPRHQAEDEANELRRKLAHASRVTMLGQLSSSLAHELSQPLSAIQHNAEAAQILLTRDPLDLEELRAIIVDVVRDDRRAAEVLQRLRSWLKQGRMHMEEICLDALAEDVLALVRSDAEVKHVALECTVPRALPAVRGDRVHLSQVLLNLVLNAMDAIVAAPGARRRILIEAHIEADHCCQVSVSDTGPGIPPDKLDQIFDPFFTEKSDGMGIGLSISRSIVEAHGGKLWAENAENGGATFRFTVPLRAAASAAPA